MKKCKLSITTATVIMACSLIFTMFIVPTASTKYNSGPETTFHTVTVNLVDSKVAISIEPLVLNSRCESDCGCEVDDGCSVEDGTCCSGEAFSFERVVLERGENHVVTLFSIENGENRFEMTITRTRLWKHMEIKDKVNMTFSLTETSVVSEGFTRSSKEFAYILKHNEYMVRGVSIMSPSNNSNAYETCFSIMNYVPADKTEALSLEIVQFNATATLSQHYAILSEVAKEMRKLYNNSQNQTFSELVEAYHAMEKEAKQISKLIQKQLSNYDYEILQSLAIVRDPGEIDPLACIPESVMNLEVEPLCGGGGGGSPPPSGGTIWNCVNCLVWIAINALLDPTCTVCVACVTGVIWFWWLVIACIATCAFCIVSWATVVIDCCLCAGYMGWIDCPFA
ncbi:MAG: hypothetical protein QW386_01150 [Candidatus Bathyarchaeia archaeon]